MTYAELWQPLTARYGEREARAVALWLLDVSFSLSLTDVVCGALDHLQGEPLQRLQLMARRLREGEPVQYVAGVADFGPRQFAVGPGVLIPRPETYELCQWVVSSAGTGTPAPLTVLDVGTGSGCIACTLALELPGARVQALDVSAEALSVARHNARRLGAEVAFRQEDILSWGVSPISPKDPISLIVSNPPYICLSERSAMSPHVLDHEPAEALFVPDDDPLLFYRVIARYALQALCPGGQLFFELNAAHATATAALLRREGFADVELRCDQFGRQRFLRAVRR